MSSNQPKFHHAIASFVPNNEYWGAAWPDSGPVTLETILSSTKHPEYVKILALPCIQPDYLHWDDNARWVVLEVEPTHWIDNNGIVEFKIATVILKGTPQEISARLGELGLPVPSLLGDVVKGENWCRVDAPDRGIAIAGHSSKARAGKDGIAAVKTGEAESGESGLSFARWGDVRSGDHGIAITHGENTIATAGKRGIAIITEEFGHATAGDGGISFSDGGGSSSSTSGAACAFALTRGGGTAIAGDFSCAITWRYGKAVAGDASLAVAWGDAIGSCEATVGKGGFALAGEEGQATVGDAGTAFVETGGTAKAGLDGTILIRWWDNRRFRVAVGYVGESGIEPDTLYRVNEHGHFEAAT